MSSENKTAKIQSLYFGFSELGINTKATKEELIKYLNTHSKEGKFDPIISEKLFQVLDIASNSSIPLEDFISGFIQFEEDIRKNKEELNRKLNEEKEIYEKITKNLTLTENSNDNGENARVYGEITDIDIKKKLRGIKEIILKIIFNDNNKEFHFKLGEEKKYLTEKDKEANKFEFKPTSRKDRLEFIMQGINNKNEFFDIGSKIFSLTEVKNSEQYLIQILIPEINDENKIAAYINAKIILFWNNENCEEQKRKQEIKIKKLKLALDKAEEYLTKIRDIYGDLTKVKINTNNNTNTKVNSEKKKNIQELDVYYNNIKKIPMPKTNSNNYIVEFNNEKKVKVSIQSSNQKDMNKSEEKKPEIKEKEKEDDFAKGNELEKNKEINISDNTNNINTETTYEEYNTNITELVSQDLTQSMNEQIFSQRTLPTIVKEKVHQVIYDSNIKTLPLIYGGKKVTYEKNNEEFNYSNYSTYNNYDNNNYENYDNNNTYDYNNNNDFNNNDYNSSNNYDFNNNNYDYNNNNYDYNASNNYDYNNNNYNTNTDDLNLGNNYEINTTEKQETQVITRKLPSEDYYTTTPVETYTTENPIQSYTQEYPTQNYTQTNINQSYSYSYNQVDQTNHGEQYYGNIQPLHQSYNFDEYRKTNY